MARLGLPKGYYPRIFSYTEEQRTALCFWVLQYFFEIKVARLKGRLDWAAEELRQVQLASIYHADQPLRPRWHQNVLTVYEFVEELRRGDQTGLYRPPGPPTQTAGGTHGSFQNCQPRPPGIPSGVYPLSQVSSDRQQALEPEDPARIRSGQRPPALTGGSSGGPRCRPHPSGVFTGSGDGFDEPDLRAETAGWRTFVQLRNGCCYTSRIILGDVRFGPYRKLGMGMWDEGRIVDHGLCMRGSCDQDTYDAWIRLLSQDEIDEDVL